jgi:hypothetical protein
MNTLSWNCRGLGQPRAVQELSRLIREYCLNIMFLSETRQHKNRVSNLRFRFGYSHGFVVDGVGKGRGLGLFWDDSVKIDILSYDLHHIDCIVWSNDLQEPWHTTFVYGEPKVRERHLMWEMLRHLKNMRNEAWLVLGDFNECQWGFEHFSA